DRLLPEGAYDFMLDPADKVAYVRIYSFTEDTKQEMVKALNDVQEKGAKGLILDLRGCPGGLLSGAVAAAEQFLARGTIVTLKAREGEPKVFAVSPDAKPVAAELPLVVLVDGTTASAGEILAGALKDHGRAVVLGSRTLGKGTVQSIVKLDGEQGAIRITSAYFELPNGAKIDRRPGEAVWGVDPSDGYFVPVSGRTREAMETKRQARERVPAAGPRPADAKVTPESVEADQSDPQLAAALRTMLARIERGAFQKVGLPAAEQAERARLLEEARKKRQALINDLKRVDDELDELRRNVGDER
ncbi:MAG: S41 family peptidase, partial [Isosphaeraceae bacterium]